MIDCIATKPCFIGGKRVRKGESVSFDGKEKEIPSYLNKKQPEARASAAKNAKSNSHA